jgi:protein-tyrosine-phosphatase
MLISRRLVAFSGVMLPFAARAATKPCAVPRILFVCPAGSVKSAIAREELKRMARARGIPVHVESRGIQPENHISPQLAARLKQEGIDPLAEPLQRFTPEATKKVDIVIAFDEAAKAPGLEQARTWRVASWNEQYDAAKADTLENEIRLLHELSRRPCGMGSAVE